MPRELHDGRRDGFEPLEPLDVRAAEGLGELLRGMSKTAFGGRQLGEALEVLCAMADDPDCSVVVTVSGAMTVGKMGRLLCEMIETGLAQIIVSTGAVMAHGLCEAIGGVHYKHDPRTPDERLFQQGYNRVYDTLEMEANLWRTQETVSRVLKGIDWSRPSSAAAINRQIGRTLLEEGQMPSILGCAYRHDVPVYVPAFTDSELGLDVAAYFLAAAGSKGKEAAPEAFFAPVPPFNPFLDLNDYARRVSSARRLGIFTVGGGVPRNWAQQVGPFVDVINMRLGTELPVPRFHYGVRICPEPAHWGGLSGCTYSEGVSWGKFLSREEGGRFAEVLCDATIAWPLLIRAFLERRQDTGRGGKEGDGVTR
jgi:deoxyhypusine synthase